MAIAKKLLEDGGFEIQVITLKEQGVLHKIFNSILLADFTTYNLALEYGTNPEAVPTVEEFKRLIK